MKRFSLFRLLPVLLALCLSGLCPAPPACAQHQSAYPASSVLDSAHGGASNDFDGTHTAASLHITDTAANAPHLSFSAGRLVVSRVNNEFAVVPFLVSTSQSNYGTVTLETTGDQIAALSGGVHLSLIGRWQGDPAGNANCRAYELEVNNGGMYFATLDGTPASLQYYPVAPSVGFPTVASTDKVRIVFTLQPGVNGSTDLRGRFDDLTTNASAVVGRDGDLQVPVGSGGQFGLSDFLANFSLTRLAVQTVFSDFTGYSLVKSKSLTLIGDSITYGSASSVAQGSIAGTNYPADLSRLLGGDWQVNGLGNPGASTVGLGGQGMRDVAGYAQGTTAAALYLGGCNDLDALVRSVVAGTPDPAYSVASIFARTKAQCLQLRAQGYGYVIVATPLYSGMPAFGGNTAAQNTALFKTYSDQLCAQLRTGLIGSANGNAADAIADFNAIPQLSDPTGASQAYFAGDFRHPDDAGYALFAPVAYKALSVAVPFAVLPSTALSTADEAALVAAGGVPTALTALSAKIGTPATATLAGDIAAVSAASATAQANAATNAATDAAGLASANSALTALAAALALANTGITGTPAATVSAMKTDSVLSRTFSRAFGKYTYNVTTHVMTLLNDDGTPLTTVTLTSDVTGPITGKQ